MIKPDEEAINRVLFFRRQFASNEVAHKNRRERDRKQSSGGH
jgi:hypothetical protein